MVEAIARALGESDVLAAPPRRRTRLPWHIARRRGGLRDVAAYLQTWPCRRPQAGLLIYRHAIHDLAIRPDEAVARRHAGIELQQVALHLVERRGGLDRESRLADERRRLRLLHAGQKRLERLEWLDRRFPLVRHRAPAREGHDSQAKGGHTSASDR